MKDIKQIRVFISSPGDLQKERNIAVEVCEQITSDLGSNKGFVIDPIRWESHTVSAKAERSQLAISDQLGKYDFYLGIMGYYFGTDTGAYASGTEEEFEDALQTNLETGLPWVSFYFSSASVDPEKINFEQYQLVENFREKLKQHGVYYRKFQDLTQFQALVRNGITKVILEMLEKGNALDADSEQIVSRKHTSLRPYEILRNFKKEFETNPSTAVHVLMMEATKNLNEFASYLKVVNEKTSKVTRCATNATKELQRFNSLKNGSSSKLERSISRFFSAMNEFVDWLSYNIPNMEKAFMQSMADLQRAAIIVREGSDLDEKELQGIFVSARDSRVELKNLSKAVLFSGEAIPKVENLGEAWEINRRMYHAITKDFSEFLDGSVDTILEIEAYLNKSK